MKNVEDETAIVTKFENITIVDKNYLSALCAEVIILKSIVNYLFAKHIISDEEQEFIIKHVGKDHFTETKDGYIWKER